MGFEVLRRWGSWKVPSRSFRWPVLIVVLAVVLAVDVRIGSGLDGVVGREDMVVEGEIRP